MSSDSIVKVKNKMPMVISRMRVRIQHRAWIVQQVGRPKSAAQNVNLAEEGVSVKRKAKYVKVAVSVSTVKVNRKILMVLLRIRIPRLAWIVQQVGRPKQAVPSVSLARQGVSVERKAKRVKVVSSDSIVKVKNKMSMVISRMRVRIQRHAWIVQQVGRPKQAAPSANRARLGLSAASKRRRVKVVSSDSIVKVKRAMVKVDLQIKLQILRNVFIVRQDGHPRWAALNVKPVELEHTVTAVNHAH